MAYRELTGIAGLVLATTLAGCAGVSSVAQTPAAPGVQTDSLMPLAGTTKRVLATADDNNNVLLYTANINKTNPPLLGEITAGVTRSVGVAIDRAGTLYVSNSGGSRPSIAEYRPGTSSPFKTITNGLFNPGLIVVDRTGNLYVTDVTGSKFVVLVYAPNASSPTRTIDTPAGGNIALDDRANLYIASFEVRTQQGTVYRVAHGGSHVKNLHLADVPGPSIGVDRAGNLYVGGESGEIAIYPPGSKTPSRFIQGNSGGFYTQLDVTPNGTIYWPNYDEEQMYEFAPGASGPTNSFLIPGSGADAAVGDF